MTRFRLEAPQFNRWTVAAALITCAILTVACGSPANPDLKTSNPNPAAGQEPVPLAPSPESLLNSETDSNFGKIVALQENGHTLFATVRRIGPLPQNYVPIYPALKNEAVWLISETGRELFISEDELSKDLTNKTAISQEKIQVEVDKYDFVSEKDDAKTGFSEDQILRGKALLAGTVNHAVELGLAPEQITIDQVVIERTDDPHEVAYTPSENVIRVQSINGVLIHEVAHKWHEMFGSINPNGLKEILTESLRQLLIRVDLRFNQPPEFEIETPVACNSHGHNLTGDDYFLGTRAMQNLDYGEKPSDKQGRFPGITIGFWKERVLKPRNHKPLSINDFTSWIQRKYGSTVNINEMLPELLCE